VQAVEAQDACIEEKRSVAMKRKFGWMKKGSQMGSWMENRERKCG